MTVVALLFSTTIPIAITDNLISQEVAVSVAIDTPITGQESREGLMGSRPVGLAKKHWFLELEGAYFLFAGIVTHAEQMSQYIKTKLSYCGAYSESIHAEVVNYIERNDLQLGFILICKNSDGFLNHFYHNAKLAETNGFGKIVVLGSGAIPLIRAMERTPAVELPSPTPGNEGAHVDAAIYNAALFSGVLRSEYASIASDLAAKSTGGNFSLIYFPELYGFDGNSIPASVEGVTHVSLRLTAAGPLLVSLQHTRTAWGSDPICALAFMGEIQINNHQVSIPIGQFKEFSISDFRRDSHISSVAPVLNVLSFQLVIDIYAALCRFQWKLTSSTISGYCLFLSSRVPDEYRRRSPVHHRAGSASALDRVQC